MYAVFEQVLDQARGAWRFRWLALITAWAICLVGWAVVLAIPDTYEASARVFVDTRTALKEITAGITVESGTDTQLQRVRQLLLGGPQLEKVARETDLDVGAVTPQKRQALIANLRNQIQISGGLQSATAGVYVISYKDHNRDRSVRVVDRLLNTFVEGALGGKREGSETAQRFLVDQISELERQLAAAEEKLATFKKQNVGLMPGAQGDYFQRLQAEMEALSKADAAMKIATHRREEIQRQLRSESPLVNGATATSNSTVGITTLAAGDDIGARIRETQSKLDDLLLRFTDRHPDVIALRSTLSELQSRQREELDAARRGDSGAAARSGLSANPVFQSIQLQLNQTEVEIAALRGEMGDHQNKIADLRRLVDTAPEVEADLARLNRDYDVTKAQYQSLVERLQRARFSEEAEQTGVVKFETIDPPSASFKPVAPNRPLMIVAILIVGLGAGGGLAYVLHQLKPVFGTPRQLGEVTGLPVLGVVSMTWLEKHRAEARRAKLLYVGAAASLAVVACLVFLVHARAIQLVHDLLA